jgi:hypothetical protein
MHFPWIRTRRKFRLLIMGPGDSPSCPMFGHRLQQVRDVQVCRSPDRITESYVFGCYDSFRWPAQHTRSASRFTDSLSTDGAVSDNHPSSSAKSICPTGSDEPSSQVRSTIAPELASSVVPCRSERLSQPLERYSPGLFFTDTGEPMTYREAMKATDAASWRLAMESEMDSIRANGTWDLVKLL